MKRTVALVLAVTAVAVLMGACHRERDKKLDLDKIITNTEQHSRAFVYLDSTDRKVQVAGLFEDDFRYKTRLSIDGRPIEDEVTNDDALAVRFDSPQLLPAFLVDPASLTNGATTSPVLAALSTSHWVLDKTGAPTLTASASDKRKIGDDPVYDALTALEYVRAATDGSIQVKKYSRDDIEPVFKSTDDPFPKPAQNSKTVRYDLRPPNLPKFDAHTSSGAQEVPVLADFRKMVVYVRNGFVVEVREVIDVKSKLDTLVRGFKLPANTDVATVVNAINAVRSGQGDEPIRVRTMRLQFEQLGAPLRVDLPTGAVEGPLNVLRYRGTQTVTAPAG